MKQTSMFPEPIIRVIHEGGHPDANVPMNRRANYRDVSCGNLLPDSFSTILLHPHAILHVPRTQQPSAGTLNALAQAQSKESGWQEIEPRMPLARLVSPIRL